METIQTQLKTILAEYDDQDEMAVRIKRVIKQMEKIPMNHNAINYIAKQNYQRGIRTGVIASAFAIMIVAVACFYAGKASTFMSLMAVQ